MKKSIAYILLCVFVLTFICSCADKEKINESSATASIESSSTITTSSSVESETDTENEKSSSKKEDSSSKKEENSSKASVGRPGENSSNSISVKVPSKSRKDVVMCGFSPTTADYFGSEREYGIYEMEAVIKEGYVNALSIGGASLRNDDIWELAVKYDLSIWCSAWDVFDSSKKSLEEYVKGIDKTVAYAKQKDEWYSRFKGFWYDEKIWRGESNADFLAETKYVYQKYGLRTYAVLATGEFSPVEGNDIGVTADQMKKMTTEAFQYVTDVAFDSYGTDVRDGAPNNNIKDRFKDIMPGIVDGKTYYQEYTKRLQDLAGHAVNQWYIPCAYIRTIAGGVNGERYSNEQYCLAHLNFFHEELKRQEYAGGLMLYVYSLSASSEKNGKKGLQHFLVTKNYRDDYLIHPETKKWTEYSKRLKEIVSEYNSEKVEFTGI